MRKSKLNMRCYEAVEGKVGAFFDRIGQIVAIHPWKIIIAVILTNGLLGIGMLRLETDIDVSRVYTPMNSQAVKDESKIKSIFPDKSGSDFYSQQLVIDGQSCTLLIQPYSGNILDIDYLDELRRLDTTVRNISTKENKIISYKTICAKRNNNCVVAGDIFLNDEFRQAVRNKNVTYPKFNLPSGEVVEYQSLVYAPILASNNQTLLNASHLKMQYYLRSDTSDFFEYAQAWEKQFIKVVKAFRSSKFDFAFSHSDSLDEELNANIGGDISLFSVTFTLMIVYACCAAYSARHDCVGNRMYLGLAGVLSAGLSIVAAFGLVSACGMSFVSIVGNVPFLIIGIGVDDMFILLSGLSDALYDGDTRSRIGQMLRISGVAITITSLTDILAFGAGISSTFKSVRNFCVYTGVAIIFCYLNQIFLFSACAAINEDRVNANRHFYCCIKTKSKEAMKAEEASKLRIFCCAGTPPKSRDDVEGFPERLVKTYFSKFVLSTPVKIITLLAFLCYLGVSIWGATNLKQGLIIKDLVSQDSYFYKYQTWEDKYFPSSIPVSFVIDKHYDYSDTDIQKSVEELIIKSQKDHFISLRSLSWLQEYKSSLFYNENNTEPDFVKNLNTSLQDPRYRHFANDVAFDGSSIIASRIYVFTAFIDSSQDQGKMMQNMRAVASDSKLSVTAFSPAFIFYEQYVAILPQTLQTLGLGIAAVFVITAIFMPHPLLLLLVVITMAMIIVGIIGFMSLWNLTLSSVTMIHLIMSVGFSVDFTAHICHAFMVAGGSNRKDRVTDALTLSGGPIFNGAVSSVLGILMLGFAKSYIFRSFFKVMLLVILFGAAHALFFLPVVLSVVGPRKPQKQDANKQQAHDEHRKDELALYNGTQLNTLQIDKGQTESYTLKDS